MVKTLSKNNMFLVKVMPDGNCLFNTLIQYLHLNNNIEEYFGNKYTFRINKGASYEKQSENLRQATVDWLEENLDYKLPTTLTIQDDIEDSIMYDEDIEDIEDYFIEMRACKHAGQIELYALSNMLKKNINVYVKESDDNIYKSIGMGNIYDKSNDENIYLYHNMCEQEYEGGYHYDLLYPKINAKITSKKKYKEIQDKFTERCSEGPVTRQTTKLINST